MRALGLATMAWVLAACDCGPGVRMGIDEPLTAPASLEFAATVLGTSRTASVAITNPNRRNITVALTTIGPFSFASGELQIPGGSEVQVEVTFTPTSVGPASGTLRLDDGVPSITLRGEGITVECPLRTCEAGAVDAALAACVYTRVPDGTGCTTPCVVGGQCQAGVCVGAARVCDDGNACTIDACNEIVGCVTSERTCPNPGGACRSATCDPTSGCGETDAIDGTLCGPDSCLALTVDVCISAQCVNRPRPDTARCANTWAPIELGGHRGPMAWDGHSVVLHEIANGQASETWVWNANGFHWEQRLPLLSPSQQGGALTWDPARQRVVFFGDYVARETLEWDGSAWLRRTPATNPECASSPLLGWDPRSRRVILSCVFVPPSQVSEPQLWAWDGSNWLRLADPSWLGTTALVTDEATGTLLALEQTSGDRMRTWVFDATRFNLVNAVVPTWAGCTAVDPISRSAMWVGKPGREWRWQGVSWVERASSAPPRDFCATALDRVRNVVVLTGGPQTSDTWEWDGTTWVMRRTAPPWGSNQLVTGSDSVFLLTQITSPTQLWEWRGQAWTHLSDAPFTNISAFLGVAFDRQRNRLVVRLNDFTDVTWEFDGTTWTQTSAPGPTAGAPQMVYSPALQESVLLSGSSNDQQFWTWNGTRWDPHPLLGPGPRFRPALYVGADGQPALIGGAIGNMPMPTPMEHWRWNGLSSWVQEPTWPAPYNSNLAAAFDVQRGVLLGLIDEDQGLSLHTWELSGGMWRQLTPTRTPPRGLVNLTWDPATQHLLYFDGRATWAYLP